MKKLFFLILLIWTATESRGQSDAISAKAASSALYEANSNEHTVLKVRGIGTFFLTVYQKFLSAALSGDCLYHPSCSRYSREVIAARGLIPGVLATGDRLIRCSGLSALEIPDFRYNEEGYVIDLPE